MNFDQVVAQKLAEMMADPRFATQGGLNGALRLLAKWRSKLVDNTVVKMSGTRIQSGPFKGMHFGATASEANVSTRLIGSYESELHAVVENVIREDFRVLVDIGCGDGYYACGFAFRMPDLTVEAFDTNPVAQKHCSELAQKNGLADRVHVKAQFDGELFQNYVARDALVFMDIEGAEEQLLDPAKFGALKHLPIIVECHDVYSPGLSDRIIQRFSPTHRIEKIVSRINSVDLPSCLQNAGHLDQLLAIWEWRVGPTPWLYMTPNLAS